MFLSISNGICESIQLWSSIYFNFRKKKFTNKETTWLNDHHQYDHYTLDSVWILVKEKWDVNIIDMQCRFFVQIYFLLISKRSSNWWENLLLSQYILQIKISSTSRVKTVPFSKYLILHYSFLNGHYNYFHIYQTILLWLYFLVKYNTSEKNIVFYLLKKIKVFILNDLMLMCGEFNNTIVHYLFFFLDLY